MKVRVKKKNTRLFFDSFKHFKNNFSNLICLELPTLVDRGMAEYLSLKSVNYKSKMPDMRKIGLIEYDKPSELEFFLSDEGEKIYSTIIKYQEKFSYSIEGKKRLDSITPEFMWKTIKSEDKKSIIQELIKLLISYYDTADSIRPYLTLIKIIEEHNFNVINFEKLCVLLAQKKSDVLMKKIDTGAFEKLDFETQRELKRPISYIINALETAGVIDSKGSIIYDRDYIKEIVMNLNEIYYKSEKEIEEATTYSGRSQIEQKKFRDEVLHAYDYKCAITGESIKIENISGMHSYLLEAAHIIPYSDAGSFSVNNGILLSAQMHKMYDRKLFIFDYNNEGNLEILVTKSKRIKDRTGILNDLDGKIISLPTKEKFFPDIDAIEYRKNNYFLV